MLFLRARSPPRVQATSVITRQIPCARNRIMLIFGRPMTNPGPWMVVAVSASQPCSAGRRFQLLHAKTRVRESTPRLWLRKENSCQRPTNGGAILLVQAAQYDGDHRF